MGPIKVSSIGGSSHPHPNAVASRYGYKHVDIRPMLKTRSDDDSRGTYDDEVLNSRLHPLRVLRTVLGTTVEPRQAAKVR